jgi:osmotically-inducible protein OsmY
MKGNGMRTVVLMVALLVLHGCATGVAAGYGQGGRAADGRSYQEAQADNRISAAVNTALVREGFDLDVQTYQGVVTLTGFVKNRTQVQRAIEIARGVPGVREVHDRMRCAQ